MSDLKGKVFVVTGATEGIGKEACFDFARRGATLVIVGRNREKTERVATELATAGAESVELIVADISSLADMRRVAREVSARHDKLDVLVNNAGAVFADYKLSVDGFEQTFALNHLGYFVLTTELQPLLKATAGARIVSTASGAHRTSRIDLSTVAVRPNRRAGFNAYADSKLANILFTRELGRRLAGSGVVATCFHPGFVYTGFGANNPGLFGSAIQLAAKLTARDSKKGAETLIWLAT
ncbi:MAG: SDR family NAD(P)-dependent oxidoreductase, partial [Myxococcales bacterium]|nr:SDR family NAD(P)-dependent oxidoreductase [Myxococcales bacterium]